MIHDFLFNHVVIISVITWCLAISVKGGFLGRVLPFTDTVHNWCKREHNRELEGLSFAWANKQPINVVSYGAGVALSGLLKWITDASNIGGFIVLLWAYQYFAGYAILIVMLSYVFVLMSMGEEIGCIGTYRLWWGKYRDRGFTRSYGIKKGLQYGAFMGAPLAILTESWLPWLAGLAFVPCYFIGQSIYHRIHGVPSVAYGEPIWGAVIGLCLGYAIKAYF